MAGEYELVGYDRESHALSLKRAGGSIVQVFMQGGKVVQGMTDEEYQRLRPFLIRDRHAEAPILSREAAREFWLRVMQELAQPPDPGSFIDLDGSTLPPDGKKRFQEGREKARAAGRVVFVIVMDGAPTLHEFPRNVLGIPERMTQSLLPSDWDELSLLAVQQSLPKKRPR